MALIHFRILEQVFGHSWWASILLTLADRQLRYTELAAALVERWGARPGDGHLSKALKQMRQAGLVDQIDDGRGYLTWTLTAEAHERAEMLAMIEKALEEGHINVERN
ncbi:hypothetical protein [Micromonospora sp. WMMC250]|uniref:hypothetical protein n=1 Tax=Micromonospora sp. WMMC250 TaxID=3014781 RepID=UPI0022B6051D|nr:hypothetical protein [Micromonospora sp. WMMC250]MCZ7375257.1 hypothetical protein [Micromonospora sp. WMMC250]